MTDTLVYLAYAVTALGAAGIYVGMPREAKADRRGLFVIFVAAAAGMFCLVMHRILGDVANHVAFVILSLFALGGAGRMITHPKPVYSAVYFIIVILSTSAMLILAGAEFLGLVLVAVYAGAILVTYAFVIMLSQQSTMHSERFRNALDYDRATREPAWTVIAGFVLSATIAGMIVQRGWPSYDAVRAAAMSEHNTLRLGELLMTDMAVSVELAAILLLVAMVGAIAIARKRIPHDDTFEKRRPLGESGRTAAPY
ncbi:MAG: NADH-quinone oxidoreductase subunit J [Phycisphaerales bacterium]|nr:NADH-quinone oxidoreductase subunit J [Phycisphaerales bacterium]MCB9857788.1 NADH-quinone oxidoreductase subunit J [Phycisphaerales bacterium]MCB9863848.1 NADH-quinone oxidoreductase subunit J [Phycisphaerales bacterium]